MPRIFSYSLPIFLLILYSNDSKSSRIKMLMKQIEASPHEVDSIECPLVFMGGMGYDEQRNRKIAGEIITATSLYNAAISIPDEVPHGPKDGTVVYRHEDGSDRELPGNLALKHINDLPEDRFTRLHERRARELVAAIQAESTEPVDAIFQSVDVSTGILAMEQKPELFRRVVLLDPSSIIRFPSRWQYLKEEWRNGNLRRTIRHRQKITDLDRFEEPVSKLENRRRFKRSNRNGNRVASYVSSQAYMLHEVAQSEHAPEISIMASRHDHAYTPERLLRGLVSLDDIKTFFIADTRHGLGGKQAKLEQLVSVLTTASNKTGSFLDRLQFASGIPEGYRRKIMDVISSQIESK